MSIGTWRTGRPLWGVLVLAFLAGKSPAAAESPMLAESLPPGPLAYIEVAGFKSVLREMRSSDWLASWMSAPQYRELSRQRQFQQAQALRQIIEAQLDATLWELGEELLGEQLAVGLYPTPETREPNLLVLVRTANSNTLERFREQIEPFLVLAADHVNTSDFIGETQILGLDGRAYIAFRDEWLLASNSRELLADALAIRTGRRTGSLAEETRFQVMVRQMGRHHLVHAYLDTDAINRTLGGRFAPQKMDNPLASLLFGGILEFAVNSPYTGVTLDAEERKLVLTVGVAGDRTSLGEAYQAYFSDPEAAGNPSLPKLPETLAGMTIYRDFTNWYRHRESLIEDRILPRFDTFESGLGNLLPGKDFSEDVLPLIGNHVTIVAAAQDYSHLEGAPGVKLPGFAVVLDLARPREATDVFQLFFQTFSAILNIQAGQQGRQPWVLTNESYRGAQIAFGRYLKKPTGDRLPLVFNFIPSAAWLDNKMVVSSSLQLCKQLVDHLQSPPSEHAPTDRNLAVRIHADPIADMLAANQDYFHAQAIQEGKTQPQAEERLSSLLAIIRHFDAADVSTRVTAMGFELKAEVGWK